MTSLDLGAFHARYDKDGPRNQPFHPAMMVKVLVYGYATGVFSSRKIARKLHEDVAFRVLAARNFPAHRTIRDFRAFHLEELSELFVQVVRLAREMGLVKLGTIAVDGTKVKANASRHKAMSYGHMLKAEAELKAQIDALLKRAQQPTRPRRTNPSWTSRPRSRAAQDRLEAIAAGTRAAGADANATPISKRGRRPRRARREGGRYKRPFGVPQDKDQDNFTDPDSRIMQRAGGGFDPAYNGADGSRRHGSHHRGRRTDQQRCGRARTAHDGGGGQGHARRAIPNRPWPTRVTAARRCSRRSLTARTWSWLSDAKARATVRSTKPRCR